MLNIGLQFFAHKKGGGSTKNGRDSNAKRLGPKRADGQFVLCRQHSCAASAAPTTIRASTSVSALTILLYAKESGVLRFERLGKDRKQASVYPAE